MPTHYSEALSDKYWAPPVGQFIPPTGSDGVAVRYKRAFIRLQTDYLSGDVVRIAKFNSSDRLLDGWLSIDDTSDVDWDVDLGWHEVGNNLDGPVVDEDAILANFNPCERYDWISNADIDTTAIDNVRYQILWPPQSTMMPLSTDRGKMIWEVNNLYSADPQIELHLTMTMRGTVAGKTRCLFEFFYANN